MPILVLQGPPGAGKSTTAKHLKNSFLVEEVEVWDECPEDEPANIPQKLLICCQRFPEWLSLIENVIILHLPPHPF